MVNLCWPYHEIGQGHPNVMIYIIIDLLYYRALLPDVSCQCLNHMPSDSVEEDF